MNKLTIKLVLILGLAFLVSCGNIKYTGKNRVYNGETPYDRYKSKQLEREQLRYYRSQNYR